MVEWKKVERNAHKFENEGDELVGKYLRKEEGQYENPNFVLEVNGREVTVFGKTALVTKMSLVKDGSDVKIIYLGEKKSQDGKRTYHDFDVYSK